MNINSLLHPPPCNYITIKTHLQRGSSHFSYGELAAQLRHGDVVSSCCLLPELLLWALGSCFPGASIMINTSHSLHVCCQFGVLPSIQTHFKV